MRSCHPATPVAAATTFGYTYKAEYYEDEQYLPLPRTNCISWQAGVSGCMLWSQTYSTNFITSIDNGLGLHQTFTWDNARDGALLSFAEQLQREIGELHLQHRNRCFELGQSCSQISVGLAWPQFITNEKISRWLKDTAMQCR